jgi:hypothetical protein
VPKSTRAPFVLQRRIYQLCTLLPRQPFLCNQSHSIQYEVKYPDTYTASISTGNKLSSIQRMMVTYHAFTNVKCIDADRTEYKFQILLKFLIQFQRNKIGPVRCPLFI